jgi:hypothetical protein
MDRPPVHELSAVNGHSLRFKCRATSGCVFKRDQVHWFILSLNTIIDETDRHRGGSTAMFPHLRYTESHQGTACRSIRRRAKLSAAQSALHRAVDFNPLIIQKISDGKLRGHQLGRAEHTDAVLHQAIILRSSVDVFPANGSGSYAAVGLLPHDDDMRDVVRLQFFHEVCLDQRIRVALGDATTLQLRPVVPFCRSAVSIDCEWAELLQGVIASRQPQFRLRGKRSVECETVRLSMPTPSPLSAEM